MTRICGEHFRADGKPKRRFKTRQAAITHAERNRVTGKRIYECSICHGFHFATRREDER